jgi:hypothetical protein
MFAVNLGEVDDYNISGKLRRGMFWALDRIPLL